VLITTAFMRTSIVAQIATTVDNFLLKLIVDVFMVHLLAFTVLPGHQQSE
jgi:nicotinamide riboside transporter PnuC